jgi:hypothetical protein
MRRWKLAAIAIVGVLAAPSAEGIVRTESRAYAEGGEGDLQYYKLMLNEFCSGSCVNGPLCCRIVPLRPTTQG